MHPISRSAGSSSGRAPRHAHLTRLSRALYEGKQLAGRRRRLGIPLVLTGALAISVGCLRGDVLLSRTTLVLRLLWVALLLPFLRVLYLEWRNDRLTESLRARIVVADDNE